jgi:hypothetical protein
MDIHALRLSVGEEEINALAAEYAPGTSAVENLRVRLTPEGITILGDYPTMLLKMAFETLWEVKGIGSVVEARLASIKVSGLPASMLRGILLKTIRDMTAQEPGVQVDGDFIRVDLNALPALQKLRLRMNLTSVRCELGLLHVEAGS